MLAELAALDVGHVGQVAQEHDTRRSMPGSRVVRWSPSGTSSRVAVVAELAALDVHEVAAGPEVAERGGHAAVDARLEVVSGSRVEVVAELAALDVAHVA